MSATVSIDSVRRGLAPDPARFFVPIQLDRERVLCFDNTASFLIYQRFGANFWRELFESDPADAAKPAKNRRLRLRSQETFEWFVYVGLQRDAAEAEETLTLGQVRAAIFPTTIGEIATALLVALSATRQRPEHAEKRGRGNAPAAAAGVADKSKKVQ
jgi:hypothetical protein